MNVTITLSSETPAVVARARRRIMRRILPYLFFIYIIAFLDRVNVGYAALEMSKDLGFSAEVYGFGAGIFFIGYFLLEIPGSLIVEHWSARKWIARIMVTWGLLAIGMGFIKTPMQFYIVRFFLGAAEAGFFPGIIVYLSHWVRYADRAKALALFTAVIPLTVAYFLVVTSAYGLTFWLPTLVKKASGYSNLGVGFLTAIPWCLALLCMVFNGWSSDRTEERRWHTASPILFGATGLLFSALLE